MKIGIITFHFVNNFGGVLQAYALQRVIRENCQCDSVVLDYRNWFIRLTDAIRVLPITKNIKEVIAGLKSIGLRLKRRERFEIFIKKHFVLTKKYIRSKQLKASLLGCDKYICGSDQIWNPYLTGGVDSAYFLQFVDNAERKIAYSPSFGIDKTGIFTRKIKKNLETFEYLSVRESEGCKLIKELTGKEAIQLIDPTFLLSEEKWSEIASLTNPEGGKYILLYIMQKDAQIYEYVKHLKESYGMKVIEISRYGYNPGFIDEILVDVGPIEFLGLFKNAAHICTNSYHGLIYSIIFNKDCYLINCRRFTSRILNLLNLLEIGNIDNLLTGAPIHLHYDHKAVRDKIISERKKAISYLRECIYDTI